MPEQNNDNKVNDFLKDIQLVSVDKAETVEAIRDLFHQANNKLSEDIKYGGLVFNLSGVLIGGIFVYKKHISIEFSNGAEFADPFAILDGKGKMRRHIKVLEKQDIETKEVAFFVKQAVG